MLPLASSVADRVGEVSFASAELIVMFCPAPDVVVPPVPVTVTWPCDPIGVNEPTSVVNKILTIPDDVIVIWLLSALKTTLGPAFKFLKTNAN